MSDSRESDSRTLGIERSWRLVVALALSQVPAASSLLIVESLSHQMVTLLDSIACIQRSKVDAIRSISSTRGSSNSTADEQTTRQLAHLPIHTRFSGIQSHAQGAAGHAKRRSPLVYSPESAPQPPAADVTDIQPEATTPLQHLVLQQPPVSLLPSPPPSPPTAVPTVHAVVNHCRADSGDLPELDNYGRIVHEAHASPAPESVAWNVEQSDQVLGANPTPLRSPQLQTSAP